LIKNYEPGKDILSPVPKAGQPVETPNT